jgi:hypothetical protein
MVASILSKKIAAGSTHLVLDIPWAPPPRCAACPRRSACEAVRVRGRALGLQLDVVITDGRQPIGRGIGPVLEARDVMRCCATTRARRTTCARRRCAWPAAMIEFDPDVRGGDGLRIARDILDSGRALAKMNAIIDAQGRRNAPLQPAPLSFDVDGRGRRRGGGHRQPAPGTDRAAGRRAAGHAVQRHTFPDGETRLRLPAQLPPRVALLRGLQQPNAKLTELLLAAAGARELGAQQLALVSPYLAYMRQDIAFTPGEVVSQRHVGRLLAGVVRRRDHGRPAPAPRAPPWTRWCPAGAAWR